MREQSGDLDDAVLVSSGAEVFFDEVAKGLSLPALPAIGAERDHFFRQQAEVGIEVILSDIKRNSLIPDQNVYHTAIRTFAAHNHHRKRILHLPFHFPSQWPGAVDRVESRFGPRPDVTLIAISLDRFWCLPPRRIDIQVPAGGKCGRGHR